MKPSQPALKPPSLLAISVTNNMSATSAAYRLITDKHDIHSAETEWLDRWAGPFRQGETDMRGFEWGYLKNLGHRESMTLRHPNQPDGKPCRVYQVRYSPDGIRVVSAAKDGLARIWDLRTGKTVRALEHRGTEVNAAVFSPDGTRVATASDDGGVRIWDAVSGVMILRIPAHRDEVSCLEFTPDGRRLVSGSHDGDVAVWDAVTGRELARRRRATEKVDNLKISPDGTFAVAGGYRGRQLAVLSLSDYSVRYTRLPGPDECVEALDIAPDNRCIATNAGIVALIVDLTGTLPERGFVQPGVSVRGVAFSPDQSFLVSCGLGDLVWIWDLASGRRPDVLPGHTDAIWCVAVSPNGREIASRQRGRHRQDLGH